MKDYMNPKRFDVPVNGGNLRVGVWGDEGPIVLAIHGITASHMQWPALAKHVEGVRLVAPDLRGRGGSAKLPGPFGMRAHAEDAVAILDHLGAEKAVVVGHSMGGWVATSLALHYPERVTGLVLADGGTKWIEVPEETDIDELLTAILGPSIARLQMTFANLQANFDYWKEHPSLGPVWGEYTEAFAEYDLVGSSEPELRSAVSLEAIREDSKDTLRNPDIGLAIEKISHRIFMLRAPRGIMNEEGSLIPDEVAAGYVAQLPNFSEELVPDTNHYTLLLGDAGASVASNHINELIELGA